jgi:hypothetical protein
VKLVAILIFAILAIVGVSVVMVVFMWIYVLVFGRYSLGRRGYRSLPDLAKHVSELVGLASAIAGDDEASFHELDAVSFKGPLASGRRAGIRFWTIPRGSSSMTVVLATVAAAKTVPPVNIKREGFFSKVGKAVGLVAEIEVGDAAFDARFAITSAVPEKAKQALVPGFRAPVTQLFERFAVHELSIYAGECLTAEFKVEKVNPEDYAVILGLLDEAARALDEACPAG